jgi:L-2-hydroxycarboxylate dehydrogenase (NAD+)
MLPGQPEAQNAAHTEKAGGLLFTTAEVEALNEIADEVGFTRFDAPALGTYDVP